MGRILGDEPVRNKIAQTSTTVSVTVNRTAGALGLCRNVRNFHAWRWFHANWGIYNLPGAFRRLVLDAMYAIRNFLGPSRLRELALLAVVLAVPAFAAGDAPPAGEETSDQKSAALFKRLDTNSDGFITVDEIPQEKQRLLQRLVRSADADKDGKLSGDEFSAGLKGSQLAKLAIQPADGPRGTDGPAGGFDTGALFNRWDANGDGKITAAEVPDERREGFSRLLERADSDSDGALSRGEFDKVRDLLGARFGKLPAATESVEATAAAALAKGNALVMAAKGKALGAAGKALGAESNDQGAAVVFQTLDEDGDGKLSADEISKASDSLAALDKDGDGSITLAELQRAHPQMPVAAAGAPNAGKLWQRLLAGDKNRDGKLSEDELPERFRRGFSRLDANGDGTIDQNELTTGLERFRGGAGKAE
jgi:Ca2+-binding EF-hand superfamily protein